jgi:UDP-2,3-diacylglucosamine hydrolase
MPKSVTAQAEHPQVADLAALDIAWHEMQAPKHWRCIDFISDLHLQTSEPANFLAWRNYLNHTPADAVFILGDLFELWIGDDVLTPHVHTDLQVRHMGLAFEDRCVRVLHHSAQSKALYFMHGNRDFLIGPDFSHATGMRILPDPTVLIVGTQRYLLSHGDALCIADTDYQSFRAQVRSPAWQQAFLAQPLAQRQAQALQMRAQSEARKQLGGPWVDVDLTQTRAWMDAAQAQHMVHGHTHEGVDHPIESKQGPGVRHVLSDWHADAQPPRAQVLRITVSPHAPATVQRLPLEADVT